MRISLRHNNVSGFTIIELIAVLAIIGIVAVVVIAKAIDTSAYSAVSEAEILKANLRFAQVKSMGDVSPDTWGINVSSSSYTLTCIGANCPWPIPNLPGGNSATHTFGGVTASPSTNITFDNWGSPGTTTFTITLTGGSQAQTVTVTKNTGFIP